MLVPGQVSGLHFYVYQVVFIYEIATVCFQGDKTYYYVINLSSFLLFQVTLFTIGLEL